MLLMSSWLAFEAGVPLGPYMPRKQNNMVAKETKQYGCEGNKTIWLPRKQNNMVAKETKQYGCRGNKTIWLPRKQNNMVAKETKQYGLKLVMVVNSETLCPYQFYFPYLGRQASATALSHYLETEVTQRCYCSGRNVVAAEQSDHCEDLTPK